MDGSQRIQWSGIAAMVGGVLCAVSGLLLALRTPGVPGGAHRVSDDLMPWIIGGLVLIVVGLWGLDMQHTGRARGLGRTAVALAILGVALMVAGIIAGWTVFIAGYSTIILSLLLAGIASLLSGALPRWASILFILTPICLFLFNTEDARAWLLVPFGAAWIVLGSIIWSRKYSQPHPLGGV